MSQEIASKTILILANSRKLSGRCIAGIEIRRGRGGDWIRPVSAREHGEVSEYERQYKDGSDPKVLDVVRIPVLEHAPNFHQIENWVLDPNYYWERVTTASLRELDGLTDHSDLWICDAPDTRYGLNDRVGEDTAKTLEDSLRLIYVEDLQYRVFAPGADFGNSTRRILGTFTHGHTEYRIFVTDPVVERELLARNDEFYDVGSAYLTVSLAEPHEGYCYKVIAAVMPV